MKNSIKPILLLFMIALTISACKKTDSTVITATGTAAVVTGQNFGFDGAAGVAFNSNTAAIVKVGTLITISAIQDGTSNAIKIVINNVTAAGTFVLDKDNTQGNGAIITKDNNKPTDNTLNYSTDNTSGVNKGSGQVKITSLTGTDAEGTFNIVAYNSAGKAATVSQGTFKGHIN